MIGIGAFLLLVGGILLLVWWYYERRYYVPRGQSVDEVQAEAHGKVDFEMPPKAVEDYVKKVNNFIQAQLHANVVSDALEDKLAAEARLEGTKQYREAAPDLYEKKIKKDKTSLDLENKLLDEAVVQGVDVQSLMEFKKKKALDELEVMKQVKLYEAQLKAGFAFEMKEYQHLTMLKDYIFGLLTERKYLEQAPGEKEPAKHEKMEFLAERIEFMKGELREKERLLQARHGQITGGGEPVSDDGNAPRPAIQGLPDEV